MKQAASKTRNVPSTGHTNLLGKKKSFVSVYSVYDGRNCNTFHVNFVKYGVALCRSISAELLGVLQHSVPIHWMALLPGPQM
jgi:hypothetical protein